MTAYKPTEAAIRAIRDDCERGGVCNEANYAKTRDIMMHVVDMLIADSPRPIARIVVLLDDANTISYFAIDAENRLMTMMGTNVLLLPCATAAFVGFALDCEIRKGIPVELDSPDLPPLANPPEGWVRV